MTLLYQLFGIPRTREEFVKKSRDEGKRILISYETNQNVVTPGAYSSPYMAYEIYLVLRSVPIDEEFRTLDGKTEKHERKFEIKLESGAKTQFPEKDPLAHEALGSVSQAIPEIIQICKKYDVRYKIDERTSNLLMSHEGTL